MRLDEAVRNRFQTSWGKARDWISTGKIWHEGRALTDPALQVDPALPLELKMNAPRAGHASARKISQALSPERIVHVDTQLIVLDKPSGINTVPYDDREKDSLEQLASRHLGRSRLIVVHRVDRETSGLVVFARTHEAGKALANQFRFHTVRRRYFALAHGDVRSQTIRSWLVENRGDGLRGSIQPGSTRPKEEAKEAITHVTALERVGDLTLVECQLETGRTHQIRIHLSEAGHPLAGEKAYIREFTGVKADAPRLMLHAAELGFRHPTREEPMRWTRLPPEDFLKTAGERSEAILRARLKDDE